jgi:hypothetical protein
MIPKVFYIYTNEEYAEFSKSLPIYDTIRNGGRSVVYTAHLPACSLH